MSTILRSLIVKIGADLTGAQKGFKQASKELKAVGKELTSTGKGLTMGLTLPIVAAGVASVKLASDLEETMSKVDMTFEDNANQIKAWSKTAIEKMGLAQQTAMDAAALFGDMGKGMGVASEAGLEMSMSLTQLSGDLASFKNIAQERVQQALTGVYTGETEALKSLGIVMTEANLKQFAMSKGIKTAIKDMTQAEKVQLRYNYVMSVTADAQGDFVRTGGGAANQARMLQEQVKQLGASFGQALLPAVTDALKSINGVLKGFQNLSPQTKDMIVKVALLAAAMGPVMLVTGKISTGLGTLTKGLGLAAKAMAGGEGLTGAFKAFLGPAGLTKLAIIAAIAAIGALMIAFGGVNAETKKLKKEVDDLITSIEESKKQFKEQTAEIDMSAGAAAKLADELYALEKKENKSNAEKYKMRKLVEQLNSLYPDLELAINESTGALNKSESATKKLIAAKKEEARVNAYIGRYTDLLKEEVALKEAAAKAQEEYNRWLAKPVYERYRSDASLTTGFQAATDAVNSTTAALKENEESLRYVSGAIDGTAQSHTDATEKMAENNAALGESTKELADLTEEELKRIEAATQDHYTSMGSIYDSGIKQNKTSLATINKNLKNQVKEFQSWRDNLKRISAMVPADVYAELVKLGPEANTQIAQMLKPENKALLDEFVALMQDKARLAREAALGDMGLGGLDEGVTTSIGYMKTALNEGRWSLQSAAEKLGESIPAGLQAGIAKKIREVIKYVQTSTKTIMNAVKNIIKPGSPSKVTTEYGESMPEGIALGIKRKMGDAIRQAKASAAGLLDVMSFTAPLPALSLAGSTGFSGISGISARQMGTSDGEAQNLTIEVPVYLDGYQIARVSAPYMDSELATLANNKKTGRGA